MREEVLFTVDTPYRHSLPVKGWYFGNAGEKSLAVMGALRGNEIQQMYICARLIQTLKEMEQAGQLAENCGILVIPCANQFSMNVGRRFWAADNTDINRMFPGYDRGETTQRIAARIFSAISGYRCGIHMAGFYLPGDLLPHVRMMETGYQQAEEALDFGLPYVVLRKPQPYDTTTLNCNRQIWDTQAFSVYTHATDSIDPPAAQQAVSAILRFLHAKGLTAAGEIAEDAAEPLLFREEALQNVLSSAGGLFMRCHKPGDRVSSGEVLGRILDPCTCEELELLRSPCPGTVFFTQRAQLIDGHEVAFRVLPEQQNQ